MPWPWQVTAAGLWDLKEKRSRLWLPALDVGWPGAGWRVTDEWEGAARSGFGEKAVAGMTGRFTHTHTSWPLGLIRRSWWKGHLETSGGCDNGHQNLKISWSGGGRFVLRNSVYTQWKGQRIWSPCLLPGCPRQAPICEMTAGAEWYLPMRPHGTGKGQGSECLVG